MGLSTLSWIELSVGGGTNVVSAQGGRGTGAPFRMRAIDGDFQVLGFGEDTLIGGPGRDRLTGYGGPNTIRGGAGADILSTSGGGTLRGGPAADELREWSSGDEPSTQLFGGGGNDAMHSGDGWRDAFDGGAGDDSAVIDEHYDTVKSVEQVTYYD